jgi:hypothetical protein
MARVLYKVTTFTATDTWTDVSPTTDYIPELPYGLGIDISDSTQIELMATDGTTPRYYSSSNTATSWTNNGTTNYRTVKRIGDALIFAGVGALDLSVDGGTTVSDKTGNLAVVWGAIGTIKQVLIVV